ncbi:hypothetical protein COCC4DRAFT_20468 [Bipolaris maydis ATCC 48331]|uniref:Uncharacterized protein n=2 Tax=Cochliobolus heterostrophus TaxID=5016 RepID=M2UUV1_COCH5|nr:uncharacterized protein COCC4DRAFT_20468 [Bipolaris maydis ATCC 48331]EMD91632.1 hypothetical protein COCHEDRAFT_1030418 [Bipolaris maydis C5]ENI08611.1 hypothetical protein COCC4DRAFT_20468 [Bipolaris maydis ATCC 48331]
MRNPQIHPTHPPARPLSLSGTSGRSIMPGLIINPHMGIRFRAGKPINTNPHEHLHPQSTDTPCVHSTKLLIDARPAAPRGHYPQKRMPSVCGFVRPAASYTPWPSRVNHAERASPRRLSPAVYMVRDLMPS